MTQRPAQYEQSFGFGWGYGYGTSLAGRYDGYGDGNTYGLGAGRGGNAALWFGEDAYAGPNNGAGNAYGNRSIAYVAVPQ